MSATIVYIPPGYLMSGVRVATVELHAKGVVGRIGERAIVFDDLKTFLLALKVDRVLFESWPKATIEVDRIPCLLCRNMINALNDGHSAVCPNAVTA